MKRDDRSQERSKTPQEEDTTWRKSDIMRVEPVNTTRVTKTPKEKGERR